LYEYSGRSDRPQPSYLNQILTSWRPDLELATEKSLEWRITGVPLVDVDAKQIKAGILDLASRVHVSSAKSGRVRFATRRTMDGKAVVSLTAPAISKDLESLTEELSKLPPYRGSKLGGLGAYLARIGASIEVQHSPGVGDSIELYFPGLPEAKDAQDTLEVFPRAAESSACPKSQKAIPAGTPITALVVDDEPGVRKLVAMTMRRALNWKVMEAGDIEEALRAAKSHDGPIHVLFSDVVLPRASGGTIAAEVTKFHPDIRVIFASAYDELSGIRRLRDQRPIWFIRKAFTSEALLKLLNEVVTSGADQHSPTGTPDL
jgi:CheY-like chemotaxis protein